MSATWCECGDHLIDPGNNRAVCPVCLDKRRLEYEARVAIMGWKLARVFGTGAA